MAFPTGYLLAALGTLWCWAAVPAAAQGPAGDGSMAPPAWPGMDAPPMAPAPSPEIPWLPPPIGWTAAEFAAYPHSYSESILPADDAALEQGRVSASKDGFFQKIAFYSAWIARPSSGDVGLVELESFLTVAVPAPSREWPLLITPGLFATLFDAPAVDLPAAVYRASLELMWLPKLTERWQAVLSLAPGVYSDLEGWQDKSLRFKARALAMYQTASGQWQWALGILYLNRADFSLLPAGGVIWTPHDDLRYEILFPRPRFAHRLAYRGDHEDWCYALGEFGGDTWSFQDGAGMDDRMTLRDWRLLVGFERKRAGGAAMRIEAGYVFSRVIEFDSARPDLDLNDTVMIRAQLVR